MTTSWEGNLKTESGVFAAAARALDQSFAGHARAGTLDQLVAAYYADDAQVLPPNVPLVHGHGQIRELFREMLDAGVSDVTRETTELHVEGDLGYGVGTYSFAIRTLDGEPILDNGKYALVYRRQTDGTWKVAVDVFSSDLPAR